MVGEIHDETDIEEEGIDRISDDTIECDGSAEIRHLNVLLGVEFPNVEHRSVNGFILEELGQVPRAGERFETGGVQIDILEATETQVVRARLTRLDEASVERDRS